MSKALAEVDPALVLLATEGDGGAVTQIVRALERPIYSIAFRMLIDRGDAEDATQEALIRVVTRLSQFRGESAFATWAYKIAVRRILDFREQRAAAARLTTEAFAADLESGLDMSATERTENAILYQQMRTVCSRALLHCLDGDHRIAFVLGDVLDLSSAECAEILAVEAATFRKRLSRARAELSAFLGKHCGIVSEAAACRCHRRVERAITLGRVKRDDLDVDRGGVDVLRSHLANVTEMKRATELYRDAPELVQKRDFVATVRSLLESYKELS